MSELIEAGVTRHRVWTRSGLIRRCARTAAVCAGQHPSPAALLPRGGGWPRGRYDCSLHEKGMRYRRPCTDEMMKEGSFGE